MPTSLNILLSSLLGDKSTITNKDYSQDEMRTLSDMYKKKYEYNENMRNGPRRIPSESQYNLNPETELDIPDGPISKSFGRKPIPYDKYVDKTYKDARGYNKEPNKTSLNYNDYPDDMKDTGIVGGIKNLGNPSYNLATTIGRANVHRNDDGSATLRDMYDFGSIPDNGESILKLIMDNKPRTALDLMMSRYGSVSRPMEIQIPK